MSASDVYIECFASPSLYEGEVVSPHQPDSLVLGPFEAVTLTYEHIRTTDKDLYDGEPGFFSASTGTWSIWHEGKTWLFSDITIHTMLADEA